MRREPLPVEDGLPIFMGPDELLRRVAEPRPEPKPVTLTHKRRRQLRKKR